MDRHLERQPGKWRSRRLRSMTFVSYIFILSACRCVCSCVLPLSNSKVQTTAQTWQTYVCVKMGKWWYELGAANAWQTSLWWRFTHSIPFSVEIATEIWMYESWTSVYNGIALECIWCSLSWLGVFWMLAAHLTLNVWSALLDAFVHTKWRFYDDINAGHRSVSVQVIVAVRNI